MARQTLPVPFGSGLDRLSGHAVLDPSSQIDLRNVHLGPGRMELRRGLGGALSIGWGTDVIAVIPVKKTGLDAVVVYDSVSRDVRLYSTDGATFSLVGTVWTIDSAVAGHIPRVSAAELYSHVFLAHEEPIFAHRGNTRVFDVTASTLSDLKLDLDRIAPQPVKFRGVAKHLAFLFAWGYGTSMDPDRPETLRISMPGDPLTFTPEHYFLIGSPSDPIIAGSPLTPDDPSNTAFLVCKASELWGIFGYDRTTFGDRPIDMNFGLLTSRAHREVNGEFFFWSLNGPRSTTGGPSSDMAFQLDLAGPLPVAAAAPNDTGFAWYDPTENEIVFCFGTFGYVLHLKDPPRRWSYRTFGVELNSAGALLPSTGTGKLNPVVASIGTVTANAPSYGPNDDQPTFTVPWTISGTPTGNETVEVWGRNEPIFDTPIHVILGSWVKLSTSAASALTSTVTVPYYLTSFDLAVRVISGGTPGAGFTGPPDTWPAASRATKVSGGAITSFGITGLWERRSPTEHGQPFAYVGPGASGAVHKELKYSYEQSIDSGGSWQRHAAGTYSKPLTGSIHSNADRLLHVEYRMTVTGPSGSSGPTAASAGAILAPGAPTITTINPNTDELNDRHLHPIFVTPGTHGGGILVRARHDPDGSWSITYLVPTGEADAVILLDNTGGADDVRVEATTLIGGNAQDFVNGVQSGDYSETTVATASFP